MDVTQQESRRGWRRYCTQLGAVLLGPVIFLAFYVLVPPLPRWELHGADPLKVICFSPDGKLVTTVSSDREGDVHDTATIQVWELATGQPRFTWTGDYHLTWHVNFSADGQRLIADGRDIATENCIKRWDVTTGEDVTDKFDDPRSKRQDKIPGKWQLVAEPNGVKVLELATHHEHGRLRHTGDLPLYSMSTGALGDCYTSYATAPDERMVVVCNLYAKAEPNFVTALGSRLRGGLPPAGSNIHIARLWNAETCEELAQFVCCHGAEFSPDGRTLATQHCDGTVRLWDLPIRKPLLADCGFTLALWSAIILVVRLWDRWVRRPIAASSPP